MLQPVSSGSIRKPAPSPPKPAESPVAPPDSYQPGVPAYGVSMTGDIRYHEVHSKVLDNDRPVWVYLPPGYHDHPEKKYPVLYAMDGQNLFEAGTAFQGHEWHMDEAAQKLIETGEMRDTIIVAVGNTGARMDEYTPVPDPDEKSGGRADQFANFMIDELKPMIDTRYRTLRGAQNTGVLGSSLGGLVSLYLGFNHPAVYGLVGALSPSLWWAGKDMISAIAKLPPGQNPGKVWMDMGDQESQNDANHNGVPDTLDNNRELGEVLLKRGFRQEHDLFYREIPGAGHNEGSWAERIGAVLAALYPSTGPG